MEKIKQIIETKEQKCFLFCPNVNFYSAIGINAKRWGMIYRGKVDPTIPEAQKIAEFFDVSVTELIEDYGKLQS